MTRRRYRPDPNGNGWVEVTDDYEPQAKAVDSGALWGDRSYAGLRASDGTPIDTRTKHRAYMRERGLTTMDDYTNEWAKAAQARERALAGHDPSRKQDIANAAYGRVPLRKPRGREGDPL